MLQNDGFNIAPVLLSYESSNNGIEEEKKDDSELMKKALEA